MNTFSKTIILLLLLNLSACAQVKQQSIPRVDKMPDFPLTQFRAEAARLAVDFCEGLIDRPGG